MPLYFLANTLPYVEYLLTSPRLQCSCDVECMKIMTDLLTRMWEEELMGTINVQVNKTGDADRLKCHHWQFLLLHNRHPTTVLFDSYNSWCCGTPWEHCSWECLSVRALLIKTLQILCHLHKYFLVLAFSHICWKERRTLLPHHALQKVSAFLHARKRLCIVWHRLQEPNDDCRNWLSHVEPNMKGSLLCLFIISRYFVFSEILS
jgi:hypothetical protein